MGIKLCRYRDQLNEFEYNRFRYFEYFFTFRLAFQLPTKIDR